MKTVTFDDTQWQLVPKEPDDDIRAAMVSARNKGVKRQMSEVKIAADCWRAGIEAAPQPPVAQVDERRASGELWSFMRSVLTQGVDIWHDHNGHNHKDYEVYSARIDVAARERAEAWQARAALTPTAEQASVRSEKQEIGNG